MVRRKQKLEPWEIRNERKRKKNELPIRKRYLICTEGKTEALYFSHYKSTTGPLVVILDKSDNKVSLVKRTIKEKEQKGLNGEFDEEIDEVWVVLDRDNHPFNKHDKSSFNKALELAKNNNISVAYSNDSFEIFYVLHFQDLQSATHRDDLCKLLSKHLKTKYSKQDLYKAIRPKRPIAIKLAKNLLKSRNPPESANPSTSVHLLVEKLLNEPGFREED